MASLATLVFAPSPGDPKTVSLDALRRTLETSGVMARGDVFLTGDPVKEVAPHAESKETLETASKEAAGGLRLLTVRREPKKSAVKVVKGNASWSFKPDITQTLASYRRDLQGRNLMSEADLFCMKGGPILDESDFSIEETLEQGVLTIGALASLSNQTILVAKGGVKPENLISLEVDVSQTLAQLRAKLETGKLMTPSDVFAGDGGALVSTSQEPGRLIKDIVGANKLLTIISGSQTVVVGNVVKPENLKSLEVDVSQTLAQLRAKLETGKLMTPSDVFAGDGGAPVSTSQEPGRLIKDIVGANKLLTIISGSQTVVVGNVVKPENLKSLEVDVSQTLAQLRAKLETDRLMTPADVFAGDAGVPVSTSQEPGRLIKDIVGANKLLTIISGSQTVVVAKGVKPENVKSLELDGGQNLAQLRAKLEADKFMAPTDTFAGADGAAVSQGEEAGRLIKNTVAANKLLTITSGWI